MSEMKIDVAPDLMGEEGTQEARTPEEELQVEPTEPGEEQAAPTAEEPSQDGTVEDDEPEPEMFPKAYVDKLRQEAAAGRTKAKAYDDRATRLHTALVAATGRLADPSDLPFKEEHLDDEDALNAAVDELLAAKPHLASRTPRGNIGQGVPAGSDDGFSLSGWLGGVAR